MAYALVGTIGTVVQGTAGAAVSTLAWGSGESRTAGNLLICFVAVTGATTTCTTPSGWTAATGNFSNFSTSSVIFYKIAAGADTAPTIAAVTSGTIAAQLAEFSGNSATPLDRAGNSGTNSSPDSAVFAASDVASGQLVVIAGADTRSAARTPTDTLTCNNATITQAGNNNAVSSAAHYSFGYSLATTSNASGNIATLTSSVSTSLTGLCVVGASFKLAPIVEIPLPELITQPMVPATQPR